MKASTNAAPLDPFPSLPGSFSSTVDFTALLPVVFLLAFVFWVVYTLVAAYHWFRYGHRSWLAVPALAVHVFVSVVILLYMMSGLI